MSRVPVAVMAAVLSASMFFASGAAIADVLILKNGKRLEGDVTKDSRKYIIVTTDGDELLFKRDEVEDCEFDAVTGREAQQLFEEFRRLVDPVINGPEPEQYVWLTQVREYASSYSYDEQSDTVSARASVSGRNIFGGNVSKSVAGGSSRTTGSSDYDSTSEEYARRDKGIDDVFVDQWSRYIDQYSALARDPRFKQLVRRSAGAGSLMEFAKNPPPGHEVGANAVLTALVSVNKLIRTARDTKKRIDAIPNRQRILQRKIEDAQNDVARAKDKLRTAKPGKRRERAERRLNDAKDDLRKLVTDIKEDLTLASDVAEDKVNELATKRTETRQLLMAAVDQLETPSVGANAVRAPRAEESASLKSAVAKSQEIIQSYRGYAKGMNKIGLEHLREQTADRITEVFADEALVMSLNFRGVKSAGDNGYLLSASDATGDTSAVTCTIVFDEEFKDDLAVCRPEQPITLLVQVEEVQLDPPLEELPLEGDSQPKYKVTAEVLDVEEGCRIELP